MKDRERFLFSKGIVRLTTLKNPGAAFGILREKNWLLKAVTIPLIIALTAYLAYIIHLRSSLLQILSLVFIAGGACGNLIDRIRYNYVRDFFSLSLKRFPVFNLADFFILAGALLYIAYSVTGA